MGSLEYDFNIHSVSVAQWIEHRSSKAIVVSLSLTWDTIIFDTNQKIYANCVREQYF